MNEASEFSLTHNGTPDSKSCNLIATIIPDLGMASCRGRAEAFARSLSSKLRTLGSQTDEIEACPEDEPIMNGGVEAVNNSWIVATENNQTITKLQPLRNEQEAYYDFECELESPGSPVDECEYLRLIETTSNTPHNSTNELADEACCDCTDGHHMSNANSFKDKMPTLPQYVESLNALNGTSPQKLSNGHHNPVDEQHEHHANCCPSINEQNIADSDKFEDCISVVSQLSEEQNEQNSELQQQIISELQKQSSLRSKSPSPVKDAAIVENQENILRSATSESNANAEDSQQNSCSPSHIITNGHHEDGEEYVQIEVIECDINCSNAATPTTEASAAAAAGAEVPLEAKAEKVLVEPRATISKAKSHSCLEATDDEEDCRPQRVRRCSSLKTGKTPPGTPGRKKIVRFADVLGLDLADVKTFLDEIPNVPKSAYEDLEIMESDPPIQLGPRTDKLLMPLFQQPAGLPTFLDKVREKQVSLENAAVTDAINQTITGSVRVRNLDFHKSVHIRYTLDGWRSYADLQANYAPNSCDGFSDKFQFVIFGNSLNVGQRLEMAIRFQCKGQQYWDNNYGANYCFQCLPTTTSMPAPTPIVPSHHTNQLVGLMSPTVGDTWCSSFY